MKKIFAIVLAGIMMLSLAACGEAQHHNAGQNNRKNLFHRFLLLCLVRKSFLSLWDTLILQFLPPP